MVNVSISPPLAIGERVGKAGPDLFRSLMMRSFMRDFRDAKVMAHALRDALKNRDVETTHSESLELIAKTFGYDNWNILAAKIEAVAPRAVAAPAAPPADTGEITPETLHCSFCGKSQHDVKKLIAGPAVYICDQCVQLCTEIVDHKNHFWPVLGLLATAEQKGEDGHAAVRDHLRGRPTEDVASFVERCRSLAEQNRLGLQCIRRRLAMRPDEAPAPDDVLASAPFLHLNRKSQQELLTMQREAQRTVKRYDDALRIATTVLGERGQQGSA
jgi:hypothetical protein